MDMDDFRTYFENTSAESTEDSTSDELFAADESGETKVSDNFASIGGLTGMDLSELFQDAGDSTAEEAAQDE